MLLYVDRQVLYNGTYTLDTGPDEARREAIWRILERCSSLRNVHVKVFHGGLMLPEDKLLEPLRALQVENFTVQLPRPRRDVDERLPSTDLGNSFQVLRPTSEEGKL